VGILLHREASVGELELQGRGRRLWMTGGLFVLAGLSLVGLPPFGTFLGKALIEESAKHLDQSWITAVFVIVSVLTGGAVLRPAGRIFAGWGPVYGELSSTESEEEESERETQEGYGRTPAVMLLPVTVLVGAGLILGMVPSPEGRDRCPAV
jgi:multicomponent Na+:H+ antiporter subunit D